MPQNTPQKKGSERRRFYQMGYDEGFKDGELKKANTSQNTHDTLREEFLDMMLSNTVGINDIADWWINKFTTHTQELLEGLIEAIGEDEKLDDEYSEEEQELINKIWGKDNLKTPEWMRERRYGKNQERQRIRNLLTSRLSNIKTK